MQVLVKSCRDLIADGVYDQYELYKLLQEMYPYKHYSTVRKAIHIAKCN